MGAKQNGVVEGWLRGLRTPSTQRYFWKLRQLASWLMRTRNRWLSRFGWRPAIDSSYLEIGSGNHAKDGFFQLDYSWYPHIDLVWNVAWRLPFADGAFKGIFCEACLEHIPLPNVMPFLTEMRRVLAPNGALRIIVPDAELYLRTYVARKDGGTQKFPFEWHDWGARANPMMNVNRVFYEGQDSPGGHACMWDFDALSVYLERAGFREVVRAAYRQGRNPELVVDLESNSAESMYVEAFS